MPGGGGGGEEMLKLRFDGDIMINFEHGIKRKSYSYSITLKQSIRISSSF